jgi:nucleoside-diphosphate-sugar epimerase
MKKRVLVTGGAGYIGSVLVRQLLSKGYIVRVIDSLKWGGHSLTEIILHNNLEFYKGDIRNNEDVVKVLDNVNYVAHLAAIVGDPACSKFSTEANEVNWEASVNLFEKSIEAGVQRFVFASTCSNYGKMKDENSFVVETSELNPVSLYAELKVKFEDYLFNRSKNISMCATVLRFSTVYGFSPRMRFDLTVNEFTRNVTLGRIQEIWGEQFWRPYCHVDDLAGGVLLTFESEMEKVNGNVFGVGDTNENYQKGQLMREIMKIVPNSKAKFVAKDDDPRDYRVDFTKIERVLGFKITKTVPDGIEEIFKVVNSGIIADPNSSEYSNI